jgi:glucose/mannose-6-phosphate isomerase
MEAINLDDLNIYSRMDTEGMLQRINELPAQCRQAWQEAMEFELPDDYSSVNKVVILGMGGSAIGGDLVRSLTLNEAGLPVIVHRDYTLPAFVDEQTLAIISSYSGNTEETVTGFEQALEKGAKVLALTTGGKVQITAQEKSIPLFQIKYKAQPRAALGFSFLPTLACLQKLGFLADKSADVAEMVQVLTSLSSRINEKVPVAGNPAKQLALRLYGHIPVIYGAGVLSEAAHRWKTQINENGKAWAFYEVFPELNHNATVGYEYPKDLADKLRVVMLRAPSYNTRIRLRYEVTGELLDRAGIAHEIIDSEGNSLMSQMMSTVLFGDYVSYYMALLYQVDPSPVKVIDFLKGRLAQD